MFDGLEFKIAFGLENGDFIRKTRHKRSAGAVVGPAELKSERQAVVLTE